MNAFLQDLRYAARLLARAPSFTVIAAATLALGIGANTAIFSVVNAVLLKPLPYPHPEQLIRIRESAPKFGEMSVSYPNFLDWRADNRTLQGIAASRHNELTLSGSGEPERLSTLMVSASYFDVLGIRPIIGRWFTPQEDKSGSEPAAVISEKLWRSRFSSSPRVLGRSLLLDGKGYTVIGVVPDAEQFDERAEVFVPIEQWGNSMALHSRSMRPGISAIARLKNGVTIAQAGADLGAIMNRLAREYPAGDADHGVHLRPLKEWMVGDVRSMLWILLGAVGFVLLIACANVANLLLARSTVRQREMAIRAALGAERWHILRQLAAEGMLLSFIGGVVGLVLAAWGTAAVIPSLPADLPRAGDIGLDSTVLLFTLAAATVTGIAFGLVPGIAAWKNDLNRELRESGRGLSAQSGKFRGGLVILEVALAMVLLVGAGLMIRTLKSLGGADLGFNPANVVSFQVSFSPAVSHDGDRLRLAMTQLLDRVRTISGIQHAALSTDLPLTSDDEIPLGIEGRPAPTSQADAIWAMDYPVSPDYLATMSIPLLRGRFFTDADNNHSEPVAVIDQEFARREFRGQDPIGQRLFVIFPGAKFRFRIVGIVGHVSHFGAAEEPHARIRNQFYMSWTQFPNEFLTFFAQGTTFVVKTPLSPLAVASAVKTQVIGASKDQPVYNVQAMQQLIDATSSSRRFSMLLLSVFAGMALLLAAVGIYGVISYSVSQRTREIGVRVALGAARRDVLRLVLGQGAVLAAIGLVLGCIAAVALTRTLDSMLFGVTATDPLTFLSVSGLLLLIAVAAAYIPARAAMRVDPMVALRYE